MGAGTEPSGAGGALDCIPTLGCWDRLCPNRAGSPFLPIPSNPRGWGHSSRRGPMGTERGTNRWVEPRATARASPGAAAVTHPTFLGVLGEPKVFF